MGRVGERSVGDAGARGEPQDKELRARARAPGRGFAVGPADHDLPVPLDAQRRGAAERLAVGYDVPVAAVELWVERAVTQVFREQVPAVVPAADVDAPVE